MTTKIKTALALLVVAAAMTWAFEFSGQPNQRVDDSEPRVVTVIIYGSNDSLTISLKVWTSVRGIVPPRYHRDAVDEDYWINDYELAAGERIRIDVDAYVYVNRNGEYGTVSIRIEDDGRKVRDTGVRKVPPTRRTAHASAIYVS